MLAHFPLVGGEFLVLALSQGGRGEPNHLG